MSQGYLSKHCLNNNYTRCCVKWRLTRFLYIYKKKRVDYYKTRRDYRWITNLLTQSGGTQKHLFTGPFLLLYYYTPYMLCIIITIVRYTVRTLLLCIFFSLLGTLYIFFRNSDNPIALVRVVLYTFHIKRIIIIILYRLYNIVL